MPLTPPNNLNVPNRTIFCRDNLDVLKGINSNCIDLIYIDPPFNKKKTFVAPIGSSAEGASFKDLFTLDDIKEYWIHSIKEQGYENLYKFLSGIKAIDNKGYNYCYLIYMSIRLIEMHRILKETGSFYLHCDQTMSHYLKIVLDCIFGEENFRNNIAWCYKENETATRYFPHKYDDILLYTKEDKYIFNIQRGGITKSQKKRYNHIIDGERYANMKGKMRKLRGGAKFRNWWDDITITQNQERLGYPTQKPKALLERIIKASSNEGDIVLDAFCGCATTCEVAELLSRKWIGIDVSHKAYDLVKHRLEKAELPLFNTDEIKFQTEPPKRTDEGVIREEGSYIYIISNQHYKNCYKVGIAKDAEKRLNSYLTSDPLRKKAFKLEYKKRTPHYREIEKYIHKEFKATYEWVEGELEEIKEAIESYKPGPSLFN